MRVLASDRQLHLLDDGNCWDVTLARLPRLTFAAGRAVTIVDVIDRSGLSKLPRPERYDRRDVYAVAKRALSRKEIKAFALRGPRLR
jgi:hypothetical protein